MLKLLCEFNDFKLNVIDYPNVNKLTITNKKNQDYKLFKFGLTILDRTKSCEIYSVLRNLRLNYTVLPKTNSDTIKALQITFEDIILLNKIVDMLAFK